MKVAIEHLFLLRTWKAKHDLRKTRSKCGSYIDLFSEIDVLFIYWTIVDVLFICCPIVTAVSAHYEVHMHKQVWQLYTFMQQSPEEQEYPGVNETSDR
ncbi:MAG: hypothetical protein F6K22_34170 [Okeania sp. SIO2F4]|uniref:hypothetical protein n=1 Tax=Okeania sp. SIO2F4 TaxID=2607790 RepID=UPI00142B2866|nr:hypothetical protein [Okeania sp. SIO2F4]NES07401.1 hypothetical protein [Okeania sp. SIO2F4]